MHALSLAILGTASFYPIVMLIIAYPRPMFLSTALIGVCWLLVKSSRDLRVAMREHKERD